MCEIAGIIEVPNSGESQELSFKYTADATGATLTVLRNPKPPKGFLLQLPERLRVSVSMNGTDYGRIRGGDVILPCGMKTARIEFLR